MYTWHILEIHLTMLYKKNKCVILLVYYYGLLIYINIKHKSLLHAYNFKKNNFFDVINVEQFNVLWIIKLIQWYCISMIMCDFTKQIILVLLPKENISEYPNIFKLLLCAIANFRILLTSIDFFWMKQLQRTSKNKTVTLHWWNGRSVTVDGTVSF